jgi:aminomethyltransferase
MSQDSSSNLKTTPFVEFHKELGAKMMPFAGWNMPIQYAGVLEEHLCVRNQVGIFDVSHMGEIDILGEDALPFLQKLVTGDISKMTDESILYSLMCTPDGGVVDDLLVHRFNANHYFLCVNASNTDKDFKWIQEQARSLQVEIKDLSPLTAQLAVQGPRSQALLTPLCDISLDDLKYYHFKKAKIHHNDCIISRTGYTGEDGFEIYMHWPEAGPVFKELLKTGKDFGVQPIGLAARDTLRMEMGYALYGNDIDSSTSPLEAGLGWVIKLGKDGFIGQEAIARVKEQGIKKKLVGIQLLDRGVPRPHYRLLAEGKPVGELTSGTFSPSLNKGIGLGYVEKEFSKPGTRLKVEIRNKTISAEVVKPPFVPSQVKK